MGCSALLPALSIAQGLLTLLKASQWKTDKGLQGLSTSSSNKTWTSGTQSQQFRRTVSELYCRKILFCSSHIFFCGNGCGPVTLRSRFCPAVVSFLHPPPPPSLPPLPFLALSFEEQLFLSFHLLLPPPHAFPPCSLSRYTRSAFHISVES